MCRGDKEREGMEEYPRTGAGEAACRAKSQCSHTGEGYQVTERPSGCMGCFGFPPSWNWHLGRLDGGRVRTPSSARLADRHLGIYLQLLQSPSKFYSFSLIQVCHEGLKHFVKSRLEQD